MAAISMQNIVKKYGDGFPAVNDVSIDVADGEFVILVGPSGCGKSTLLRVVAGLLNPASGSAYGSHRTVPGPASLRTSPVTSWPSVSSRRRSRVPRKPEEPAISARTRQP